MTDSVPEGPGTLHLVRELRHIGIRNGTAKSLDSHQCSFRTLKSANHCQRMRKLRAENMYHIRLEILQNFKKTLYQRSVIHLRCVQILAVAVKYGSVNFSPAAGKLLRNRDTDPKLNQVLILSRFHLLIDQ